MAVSIKLHKRSNGAIVALVRSELPHIHADFEIQIDPPAVHHRSELAKVERLLNVFGTAFLDTVKSHLSFVD